MAAENEIVQYKVNTRCRNVVIILVAMFFCFRVISTALISSLFGMFVNRENIIYIYIEREREREIDR